jgi:hypothetical protein
MRVSFKIEKRSSHCPAISFRGRMRPHRRWDRRAEGLPGIAMQGETWK